MKFKFSLLLLPFILVSCSNKKEYELFLIKEIEEVKFDKESFNSFEVFDNSMLSSIIFDEEVDLTYLKENIKTMLNNSRYFIYESTKENTKNIGRSPLCLNYENDNKIYLSNVYSKDEGYFKNYYVDNINQGDGYFIKIYSNSDDLLTSSSVSDLYNYDVFIKLYDKESYLIFDGLLTKYNYYNF